ncbi:hypothetical protein G6O69_14720 [Pseudenhygromyxa sp. WMMC2535]|uniref:hypothetical protein n=1 Tax=Pseudenhygromyxa sp. WMMC2535 TaxID=2712867 RepID=UPI001551D28F|nr:hypothetical protein [Pseudenhygromyxa sp. WMMC2535]NVB39094.1 hypothetical protein [Pseudenhygromyxa sp. WMMC2535]
MRDPKNTRSLRSSTTKLAASLALIAGLGLAGTVWGGPPAADSSPEAGEAADAGDGAEASAAEAGTPEGGGLGSVDPVASSSDVDGALGEREPFVAPPASELPGALPSSASGLRSKMEASMAELGELAVDARAEEDLVRATCVLDKQDKGNDVMDLGTGELLVIRDVNTSDQARQFAVEKLDAAALRLEKLVREAKSCSGREGPEEEIDVTRRDYEEQAGPMQNPTAGLGHSPVPPPVDRGWPPAASPIE